MGFFDFDSPPGAIVTTDEFRRIMSQWSMHNLPAKYKKRLADLADAYIDQPGRHKGMDREEVAKFLRKAKDALPEIYHGLLPELKELLENALKGKFGGPLAGF